MLYRPLAGLPARIFLCSAMAPRINQHCRFSVINIPFYVTIIYHFPLQAYDLSVCFYRQRPGPVLCGSQFFPCSIRILAWRLKLILGRKTMRTCLMTNDGCNKSYQILMPPLLIFISTKECCGPLAMTRTYFHLILLNHDPHPLK